jgi:Hemoglobin-like flavoprotein
MTPTQIQLVKESWSKVIPISDAAGSLFYQRLFDVAPGVRHLFKSNPHEQSRKLMTMITMVVSKLDQLDTILEDIKGLARRHDKYGAKKEHYAVVGECLIWTLNKGLGDHWNKETEEAWATAYTILSNAMIQNQTFEESKPKLVRGAMIL